MIFKRNIFIPITVCTCFLATIGDIVITLIFGTYYPDYNHFRQPISILGESDSPIGSIVSKWWVIYGLLLVIYAFALRKSFLPKSKWMNLISWLIIIYGVGEGMGSGIFPFDFVGNEITIIGQIHLLVGGIGWAALFAVPIVALWVFTKQQSPIIHIYTLITVFAGLITFIFFSIAKMVQPDSILAYRGLWQRLWLLNYYVYFLFLTVNIIKSNREVKK